MAGGVFYGSSVHIRYPCEIAGNMHFRVCDAPFVVLAGYVRFIDEFNKCFSREALAAVVGVEVWSREGEQSGHIIRTGGNKHLLDDVDDSALGICGRGAWSNP